MEKEISIIKSGTRGSADYGWLNTKYSFSFSNYYHPERIHFGALRVINDDIIAGGRGFGMHPHDNMEIITIPLEGALAHKDSMGNEEVIYSGDVQIMSAGSGITHSEFNANADKEVKLFQIWVFPKLKDVNPRYEQITIDKSASLNNFQKIVSPDNDGQGVYINQDAWFHLSNLQTSHQLIYNLKKENNGIYILIVKGEIEVEGNIVKTRDAITLTNFNSVAINAILDTEFLVMEVPMQI